MAGEDVEGVEGAECIECLEAWIEQDGVVGWAFVR